jgi:hypothetical protein
MVEGGEPWLIHELVNPPPVIESCLYFALKIGSSAVRHNDDARASK